MNFYTLETLYVALILGIAVALVHATFQVGVSVLTLLSGHSLGAQKAHSRLLRLNGSYILGAFVMICLLLASLCYGLGLFDSESARLLWLAAAMVATLTGYTLSLVYYRRGKGTLLWLPRSIASYLALRAKMTTSSVEAAALGAMTVVAELPFALACLLVAALLVLQTPSEYQLYAVLGYAALVCLPLGIVTALLGAGHRLSTIQRWRETNKSFLQYSAGLGLIVVAFYIFVFRTMEIPV